MFEPLNLMGLAHARARHAAAQQAVVAQNVANSDTPGYRARDLSSFEDTFRRAGGRFGDLDTAHNAAEQMNFRSIDAGGTSAPNGNSVSLEAEMLRGIEAQRAHSRAIRIYQSSLTIMRSALGR